MLVIYATLLYSILQKPEFGVLEIARKQFSDSTTLVICAPENVSSTIPLENIHKFETWSVLLCPTEFLWRFHCREEHYILVLDCIDVENCMTLVRGQLMLLSKSSSWNSNGKFLILLTAKPTCHMSSFLIRNMITELENWKIINAVILVERCKNNKNRSDVGKNITKLPREIDIYSWLPYKSSERCRIIGDSFVLDKWIVGDDSSYFLKNETLFPNKIPRNFQGCHLEVTTFHYEPLVNRRTHVPDGGFEVILFNTIIKTVNMTAEYLPSPPQHEKWGLNVNGSWNGAIGQILKEKSDLTFGGMPNYFLMTTVLDATFPYLFSEVKWHVPCSEANPEWRGLIRIFSSSIWMIHFLLHFLISLLFWLLRSPKTLRHLFIEFTDLWGITLGVPVLNHVSKSPGIRVLFTSWILYSLIVNTIYQTFLTSFMTNHDDQISTEKQLLYSNMDIAVTSNSEHLHTNLLTDRYKRRKRCADVEDCLKKLSTDRNMAVLYASKIAEYIRLATNAKFCELKERFSTVWVSMLFHKGDPLLETFNSVIMHVLEAGLIDHWWEEIKFLKIITNLHKPTSIQDVNITSIYIEFGLCLMAIGWCISLIAFVLEKYYQFSIKVILLKFQK